jgi:hypothetical protein
MVAPDTIKPSIAATSHTTMRRAVGGGMHVDAPLIARRDSRAGQSRWPFPYGYPYAYPYPYYYPYVYPSPVIVEPPPVGAAEPIQREVIYPTGKYVLHGDGINYPWQWVWIPAPPPPPAPPAP